MAITTLLGAATGMTYPYDYVKVGAAGTPSAMHYISTVYSGGFPAAFATPSPGMSGAALTTYAGQMPFTNPVAGNTYLGRLTAGGNSSPCMILADRLWHNSGIDVTSVASQTINSVAWPARDQNGSTNGVGVIIGLEVTGTCGAATPNITMTYTNSSGTGSRTSTNIRSTISASGVGLFYVLGWQSGDEGVRSIQSIQLDASWISGTVSLVAYTVKAKMPISPAGTSCIDWYTAGAPRFYDNSVPFVMFCTTGSTAPNFSGSLQYTQG